MRPGTPSNRAQSAVAAAMSGAVDLAAVKARSEAAARAASAEPVSVGGYVLDVEQSNFQAEVLDRSFQVPVLLDLWAEWCEPCKQLSPLLEKLATESAGRFVLAKIDVDANPQIAQSLQVQSIPTVFAVIAGQLVPGFQGALPEPQLREFIRALLEAAQQAGLSGVPATGGPGGADGELTPEPEDPRFTEAEDALQSGDFELAAQRYDAILAAEPGNEQAKLALRQVALLSRLSSLPADAVARGDAEPDDVPTQLAAADAELADNLADEAFQRLIGLIRRLRGDDRAPVRERLVEYFDLLGPDDPRVSKARRDLSNALF
jgi:putative thioredoxin